MQRLRKYWLWLTLLGIALFLLFKQLTGTKKQPTSQTPTSPTNPTANNCQSQANKITPLGFRYLLDEYSGIYKYVYAQAQFESANFTSNVFKQAANPFGMRVPSLRQSTRCGVYNGYSKYPSTEVAVEDFVLYLRYFNYPYQFATLREYVQFLKSKNYFSGNVDGYFNGVNTYFQKL